MDILLTILTQLAQLGSPDAIGIPGQNLNAGSFTNALNVIYFISGAIAVITMIIGGILITISSGDPSKSAKGRNTIIYSAVGLVVVASAFAITNFVFGKAGV